MAKLTLIVTWSVPAEVLEQFECVIEDYMANELLTDDLENYPHPDNEDGLNFEIYDCDIQVSESE